MARWTREDWHTIWVSVWNSKASIFMALKQHYPPGRALMSARRISADGCGLAQGPKDWNMPILGLVCPPVWLLGGASAPTPCCCPAAATIYQGTLMKKFAPHSFPSNIQRLLWPTNVLPKWRLSFINSMMELRNMRDLNSQINHHTYSFQNEGETTTEYSLPHPPPRCTQLQRIKMNQDNWN